MAAEQTVIVQGLWGIDLLLGISMLLLFWIMLGIWRKR